MTKLCTKCLEAKPLNEFHKRPSTASGLCSWCKICKNKKGLEHRLKDPQKARDQKKAWRKSTPGYYLRKYWPGSTSAQAWSNYLTLLEIQGDRCAICLRHKEEFKTPLEVDHSHKTQKVRGLLCVGCNPALGSLKDDPLVCTRAAAYLIKFQ